VQANLKTSEIKQHLLDLGFGDYSRWAVVAKQDGAPTNVSTSNDENGPKNVAIQGLRKKRRHPLHVEREGEPSQEGPSRSRDSLAQTPALDGYRATSEAKTLTTERTGELKLMLTDA
jgi:hypothetical protein